MCSTAINYVHQALTQHVREQWDIYSTESLSPTYFDFFIIQIET